MKRLLMLLLLGAVVASVPFLIGRGARATRGVAITADSTVPALTACAPVPSGLVSWWAGDGNANDIAGTNNGALHNGATFATGMVGQGFSFDGVDDFFQSPTNDLPEGNGDRTLELWAKIDAFVAGEAFFAGYGSFGSGTQTYHLGTEEWHNMVFFSTWMQSIAGPVLQPAVWYHVAVTNTGNTAILYLNGTQVASGDLGMDTPAGTPFYIGQIPGDDFRRLQGQVDEVSIYNRALSADEIQAIADAGSAGKCKGPAVGGVGELPDLAESATSSARDYIALAALAAVGVVALTGGAWYARRRWLG